MSSRKFDNISEEDFLKNKAKRKSASEKTGGKKKRKKKKSSHPILKGFLIALGIIVGIIALAAIVAAVYYFAVISTGAPDEHNENNDNFINSEGNEVNRLTATDGSKKYFTFLATATDKGGSLTDVIMVARFHYDDEEPEVSVLQIPRDTYVRICGNKLLFTNDGYLSPDNFYGDSANLSIKINEAFYRGRNLATDTIDKLLEEVDGKSESEIDKILEKKEYLFIEADSKKVKSYAKEANETQKNKIYKNILKDFGMTYLQNLIYYNYGIPTDYYAQVNISGFRGVVNAIGGVDINVPTRMYYVDEFQDLYIDLYPGQQHLNGEKAEQFVRFRGYPGGDVARLDAQKLFINAFLDKVLSFSTVTKIDDIITEIQKNLYTDISFNNLLKFANKLLGMDIKNNVHLHTLPGAGEYIGPVSYFVADREGTITLVNEEFNVFNTPLIDEDFKMIDPKAIYRPAAVVTDTPENTDEENGDETDEVGEGNESDEGDETDETSSGEEVTENRPSEDEDESKGSSDSDEKTDNNEENNSREEDSEGNQNSTPEVSSDNNDNRDDNQDNNDTQVKTDNTPGTEASSANITSSDENPKTADEPAQDTTTPENVDENYQLLLDMAA